MKATAKDFPSPLEFSRDQLERPNITLRFICGPFGIEKPGEGSLRGLKIFVEPIGR